MQRIPYSDLKKGTFLIANPDINDGIFFRSVVLLCDHSPVGSFGIIINKPVEIELPKEMLNIEELTNTEISIRTGGPNQPNQIMIIHSHQQELENNLHVCDGIYLGGDIDEMQEMTKTAEVSSILLCLGYTGWATGLLEREFLSGAWFLHPASKEHVFNTVPEKMWQMLLREMGGKYKTLSMIPENLELN